MECCIMLQLKHDFYVKYVKSTLMLWCRDSKHSSFINNLLASVAHEGAGQSFNFHFAP